MKVDILDYLHMLFLHLKGGVLFVLILTIFLLSITSNSAFGQGPVAVVETPVRVFFDNKTKSYVATQNTVEGALRQGGISVGKFDVSEPSLNTFLTGKETNIKITRALPVLISDGEQQMLAFSAYTNPADIFKQLNFPIFPEDKVDSNLILDPVDENAAGQKISITRAPTFTVYVDDGSQIVRSWGKTIREVLEGKISLGAKDIVEPDLESSPIGVDAINITRVNVAEVEETINIPFETITKKDYSVYQGQTSIVQQGANGQKKQQVKITYHNGQEVNRVILSSTVTIPSQNKIIAQGVKPYSHQDLWEIMLQAQARYGVDPSAMFKVMMCESGGNVLSGKGSRYQGLFQWDGSYATWTARAGVPFDYFNPTSQIMATAARVSASGGWGAWGCKP